MATMAQRNCLYCYQPLEDARKDYHPLCSKKIFDKPDPPALPYSERQMVELGKQALRIGVSVPGAQPKLSLDIAPAQKQLQQPRRFTIVGLWGAYILKPPTTQYPHLPEVEDLTMHLATLCKIPTVPHSLIRLHNGSLAYITKRIDRDKTGKLHMEDMCQLTGRLTEHKYNGSYEQIAKVILTFSVNPVLDVVNFYEQVLFSFLTGNADMHLKNFSLIKYPATGYSLAPAYDLVASALVNPADTEELALALNGKKQKIKRADFLAAFANAGIGEKVIDSLFKKFADSISEWKRFVQISFLPADMKRKYNAMIDRKARQLEL